ncbi:MAG: glycosyltransferase family 39 protein [Patescibacteria group bacterium]
MKRIFITVKSIPAGELLAVLGLLIIGVFLFCYQLPLVSAVYDEKTVSLIDAKYVVTNFRWDTLEASRYPPLLYYIFGWVYRAFPDGAFTQRLFWGRMTLLPFYILGAVSVYLVVRRFFGKGCALVSLVLFLYNPEILAHGRLLKQDYLQAITVFASAISYYLFLRQPTLRRLFLGGMILGIALLTKGSSLLLLPIYLVFTCLFIATKQMRYRSIPKVIGLFLVALVVLHAGYLFRETGHLPPTWQSQKFQIVASTPFTRQLLYLLPGAYLRGLDDAMQISESGWGSYLWGEKYFNGRWYYFPIVFMIKTPLSLLLLLIMATIAWFNKKISPPPLLMTMMVFLIASHFFYFMFFNRINHGLRYLLMVYPLIILFIAPLWKLKVVSPEKLFRVRLGITSLLIWYVWGTISIAPHYLAYANELIGGPKNLWKYVADSNIDWGQDEIFLAQYLQTHPNVRQKIDPTPGVGTFLVNVNNVNNFYYDEYRWLRQLKKDPVDNVGYSQLVFEVTDDDLRKINNQNPF